MVAVNAHYSYKGTTMGVRALSKSTTFTRVIHQPPQIRGVLSPKMQWISLLVSAIFSGGLSDFCCSVCYF